VTNLIYLTAAIIGLVVVAKAAPPSALIAAAVALVSLVAILATITHGPSATVNTINALAHLFRGEPDS
jgi:hypothetical protein